jgi:hypothetical protein
MNHQELVLIIVNLMSKSVLANFCSILLVKVSISCENHFRCLDPRRSQSLQSQVLDLTLRDLLVLSSETFQKNDGLAVRHFFMRIQAPK